MELYRIPGYTLEGKETIITIASGPVIIRKNKVLLHRAPSTGKYQFLGGRLDDSLTVKENAIAKPKWEGLEVKLRDLPPLLLTGKVMRDGKEELVMLIHYLGEIDPEKNPTKGEWGWYTLQEIRDMQNRNELSSENVAIASEYFLNKTREKA